MSDEALVNLAREILKLQEELDSKPDKLTGKFKLLIEDARKAGRDPFVFELDGI
jgi:hypothetical protein